MAYVCATSHPTPKVVLLSALQALPVKDLPGVGWSTEQKLEGKGITTVADVLVGMSCGHAERANMAQ